MFFSWFKSKKGKKEGEKRLKKEDSLQRSKSAECCEAKSSSASIPIPKQLSRMSMYSTASRASSIGHLSVVSGATNVSATSTTSKASRKSTQSNWSYNIDRFSGARNDVPRMRSTAHSDLWVQAYAFGGR